ncbi:MAG: hypothetical protein AB2L14_07205 [Candidatus Xenobiia bacterium LiM19]
MEHSEHVTAMLNEGPAVINLGLPLFYESLKSQGVSSVQVDWKPPAQGKKVLIDALSLLFNEEVDKANHEAVQRLIDSRPVLVDICQAKDVIPGMNQNTILHAGPPHYMGPHVRPCSGSYHRRPHL